MGRAIMLLLRRPVYYSFGAVVGIIFMEPIFPHMLRKKPQQSFVGVCPLVVPALCGESPMLIPSLISSPPTCNGNTNEDKNSWQVA